MVFMDIAILMWLQQIRQFLGPVFETVLCLLSDFFGAAGLPLILILFWQSDRKKGRYFLTVLALSFLLNQFLKISFSVPRPWILRPSITPPPAALRSAGGYSFPSGHTQSACASFGSVYSALPPGRKKQKVLLLSAIAFTGFSRMFLGVHTPRDVLAGLIAGFAAVYAGRYINAAMENTNHRKTAVFIILLITAASVIYAALKTDDEGMLEDALRNIGIFAGLMCFLYPGSGDIIPPDCRRTRIIKTAVSFILTAAVYFLLLQTAAFFHPGAAAFAASFTASGLSVTLFPERIIDHPRS